MNEVVGPCIAGAPEATDAGGTPPAGEATGPGGDVPGIDPPEAAGPTPRSDTLGGTSGKSNIFLGPLVRIYNRAQ